MRTVTDYLDTLNENKLISHRLNIVGGHLAMTARDMETIGNTKAHNTSTHHVTFHKNEARKGDDADGGKKIVVSAHRTKEGVDFHDEKGTRIGARLNHEIKNNISV